MQKVEGSSPFSRFREIPLVLGFFLTWPVITDARM
jgi:hypothetical protein